MYTSTDATTGHTRRAWRLYSVLMAMLMALVMTAQAQSVTKITGTVVDTDDEPLIGATIRVAGTSQVTATDIDGRFTLTGSYTPATMLEVSYVGAQPKQVKVGNGQELRIVMSESANVLNDVVVVGYGTQKRENLTGAVSTVDVKKQLEGRPITNVASGLQGSTPGLTVRNTNGALGSDPSMKIRGIIGSVNGNSNPLILVDNVECSSLQNINPDDIESISVLKDAAASSIYGVKAAMGVILITTRQGKIGEKFTVSYSNNFSWKKPTVKPELATASEGAQMSLDMLHRFKPANLGVYNDINMYWDENTIERMQEWERVYGGYNLSPEYIKGRDYDIVNGNLEVYRSADPYSMFMRKTSFQQTHNLSLTGSSGNTGYNISLGYLGTDGLVKVNNDKYRRYNISFGSNTKLNDYVDVRSKVLYTRYENDTPFVFNSSSYDQFYYLYRWPANYPYGTIDGKPIRSSITEREQANMNKKTNNYLRLSLGATVHIIKNLSLEADYTFTHVGRYTQTNGGQASGMDFWSGGDFVESTWTSSAYNTSKKGTDFSDYHVLNALLRYKLDSKIGNWGFIAGTNIERYSAYGETAERRDLILNDHPEISLATGDQFATSYKNDESRTGFFGRVNYDWQGKYLLEANLRIDGSSQFPKDKKWGYFPSFSGGWIVSNERFMESLNPALSFMKVRASWGQIGYQDLGNKYLFMPIMSQTSSSWIIDNVPEKTFGLPVALRQGFGWETITTTNAGIDLRFINNDLGLSFDWFQRRNDDMICNGETLPSTFGQAAPKMNFGTLTTNGWELSVDYNHRFACGLVVHANAYVSDAKPKLTKYNSLSRSISGHYEGENWGEIWGYETDRLYQKSDFAYDENGNLIRTWAKDGKEVAQGTTGAKQVNKLSDPNGIYQDYLQNEWFLFGPGDVKYKDLDGDGKIDPGNSTVENHGDRKVIGNTTPRYEYGARLDLTYKGFDLSVFFQGVGKRNVWGKGQMVQPGFHYGEAFYQHHMDYWTEDNTGAFYPTPSGTNYQSSTPNFQTQSRYLLNMSYCRLKNLAFGYTLPEQLTRKAYITKCRFYVSFDNLVTFDHLHGLPIDPETQVGTGDGGYIGRSYPYSRNYSFGLQLTF